MSLCLCISEWTQTLIKFLKDQLQKLQEYYHSGPAAAGATPTGSSSGSTPNIMGASPAPSASASSTGMNEEHKVAQRQWQYCIQLARYLYEVSRKIGISLWLCITVVC